MIRRLQLQAIFIAIAFSFPVPTFAQANDASKTAWPPVVDAPGALKPFAGRKVELFRHGTRPEWGYEKPQQDYFILVHPETSRPDSRLYVVLHSAGHDAKSAYEIGTEGGEGPGGHFVYSPPADCYALYPDCRANGGVGDWWWGGPQPNENPPKNMGPLSTPAEKRVEATVRWVMSNFPIDANRVYLTGISMGGSGSLGFGVPRGDVFASILVHVPAGAIHFEQRMRFPPLDRKPGSGIPDPPVVVAYSGVDDGWAKDQATLLNGMRAGRYAFIDFWGPSGHDSTKAFIASKNDLAFSFPWLEIRKNEAYPVFMEATTDNKAPWVTATGQPSDQTGQINAFFRWKTLQDSPTTFSIELRLLKPEEFPSTTKYPKESTADVAIRRLQKFKVPAGQKCRWEFVREGTVVDQGTIEADANGLPSIPKMVISQVPAVLNLKLDR